VTELGFITVPLVEDCTVPPNSTGILHWLTSSGLCAVFIARFSWMGFRGKLALMVFIRQSFSFCSFEFVDNFILPQLTTD
jgi:hypothetical protein